MKYDIKAKLLSVFFDKKQKLDKFCKILQGYFLPKSAGTSPHCSVSHFNIGI